MRSIAFELKRIADLLSQNTTSEFLLQSIIVIISVLLGSFLTILIDNLRNRQTNKKNSIQNINYLMLGLYKYLNQVEIWIRYSYKPSKDSEDYFFQIPLIETENIDNKTYNFDNFQPLLGNTEGHNIALDLIAVQEKFSRILEVVNRRTIILEDIHKTLRNSGITEGEEFTLNDHLDETSIALLKNQTDRMIDMWNDFIKVGLYAKSKLIKYYIDKKKYPNKQLLEYEKLP